ncbi:hypothetical protein JB92DRAFT_3099301 [Gautieria morchelliformis]|nr:hypothetical protein JB92DRAFT_3099301 [Gautieria morchelliformis]
MVSPTTLLHIPPLEPPTPHPFTSTSPSSRAPSPSRPPAQLQLRMQPAHRARCAMLSPDIPNPSAPNELVASRGVDVPACTRTHAQVKVWIWTRVRGRRVIEHFPRTVGTKSRIGERQGLTLSFSLRSVGRKPKAGATIQLLSVWLCKISESVLIELRKTMPAQPLFTGNQGQMARIEGSLCITQGESRDCGDEELRYRARMQRLLRRYMVRSAVTHEITRVY